LELSFLFYVTKYIVDKHIEKEREGGRERKKEKSLFAISVTINTITISHNGRLTKRKTPSQL